MATYKFLKDLTIGKDNHCIKVRITREWQVKSTDNKYVIAKNYVLLDEEGTQIQAALLENSLIPMFKKNLKLGEVYVISTYNVVPAYATYRPVPGELVIKFHRTTETEKLSDISISTIPMYKFQMTDFEKARTKAGETINLMDVVGKLKKVTDMQTTKKGRKMIDIILANERDDNMRITLWENQAHAFLECKTEYIKPNVFVIVTSTSAKNMQGDIVLWSSSSTQFFFNIDHPSVVELRNTYKMDDDLIPAIVPFVKTQQHTMVPTIERVTISQLFKAQLPNGADTILFTSEATVIGINLEKGWYYTGCNKCYKTMPPSLACTRCTQHTSPIPLYRVKAEVKDSTSDTTFMLFERHILKMINVSAEHLLNNDKNASQDVIPPVLNNILGRKYLFKLTLNKKNTTDKYEGYTVTDVLEEITHEDPLAATSATIAQSKDVNQDNSEELKDDLKKKRSLPTQEQNPATDAHNNDTENRHPSPPAVSHLTTESGNHNEHRNKRQKNMQLQQD